MMQAFGIVWTAGPGPVAGRPCPDEGGHAHPDPSSRNRPERRLAAWQSLSKLVRQSVASM